MTGAALRLQCPRVEGLLRWLVRMALLCAAIGWAGSARAKPPIDADGGKRLAIHVEGKNAAALRDQIIAAAPEGIVVLEGPDFDQAMRVAGLPPVLGAAIQLPAQRKLLLRALNRAMDRVNVDAVLLARELIAGRKHELGVVFYLKGAKDAAFDERIDLGDSDNAQRKAIKKTIGPELQKLAPPPPTEQELPPEKSDEEKERERKAEEEKRHAYKPHVPGGEIVALRVGAEIGGRWFRYNDPVSSNTRPFSILGPPAIAAGVEVYPAAFTRVVVVRDLGLYLDYAHYPGFRSQTGAPNNLGYGGTWNRLNTGLRFRIRLGDEMKPFVIGIVGGYGFHNFVFNPDDDAAAAILNELPSVKYQYLRAGVDARLPFSIVALLPRFSYLGPLASPDGTVYPRFRSPSTKAIEAGLDIAFVLPLGFELRGGATFTRYFSSFQPEAGDAFVAGGAADNFLAIDLAALYRY